MPTHTLQVRKDQLTTTRLQSRDATPLQSAQVRVAIERFALTSNNITYAAFGDAMHYWDFFPVANDAAWGCIPVWGFGTVVESTSAEVPVGEHLYGYFPMASEVVLTPGKVSATAWSDMAAHRASLHPVYNQYTRTATDPFYRADTEGVQALLRPLFITSWLIDDFLADQSYFGAADRPGTPPTLLLSSASSKTAYGTAFQMKQRGNLRVVGLTSARNVAFCESLGCYDQVLRYDQLDSLAPDAPSIYIDFAGNAELRRALHTHCRGLAYSCAVGGTHVQALGNGRDLPGPKPVLFFAPAQIKKRNQDWGAPGLGARLVQSWHAFVQTVCAGPAPWLQIEEHVGATEVQAAYTQVLAGQGDARSGHMLRFS